MAAKKKMSQLEKAREALAKAQKDLEQAEALEKHAESFNSVKQLCESIGAETCCGVANSTLKELGLKMKYIGVSNDSIADHIRQNYLKSLGDSVEFTEEIKKEIAGEVEGASVADVGRTLVTCFDANGEGRGKTSKYKLPA